MRLYAFTLALLVLRAHAASIKNTAEKIDDDLANVELDDVVNEPELVEQAVALKEVDNNLRNAAEIPVVVVEEQTLKKIDENSNDYIPDINESVVIKRAELDLKNPGPPQRQQHETQNPDSYAEKEKSLIVLQEKIDQTRNSFREDYRGVSASINDLLKSNANLPNVQQSIENLKIKFSKNIAELNDHIQSFASPGANVKSGLSTDEKPSYPNIDDLQSKVKKVQKEFEKGIGIISEGAELLVILREEDEVKGKDDSSSTSTDNGSPSAPAAGGTDPNQGFVAAIQSAIANFGNTLQSGFTNIFNFNQNQSGGTGGQTAVVSESDDPNNTQAPNWFQTIQSGWQNITQGITQFNPFANANTNNVNTAVSTAQNAVSNAAGNAAGTAAAQAQAVAQPGPIQQIIQTNPITRVIQNTLQRLQPTTTTPKADTPRDTLTEEKKEEKKEEKLEEKKEEKLEEKKDEKIEEKPDEKIEEKKEEKEKNIEDPKGHYYGGNYNNQGDNNDSSRLEDKSPQVENLGAEPVSQDEPKDEQKTEEKQTPAVSDKTE